MSPSAADEETFKDFITRIGKREVKSMLEDLTQVPSHEENSWYYQDWGDTREFTMDDLGKGECAGEVVSITTHGNRRGRARGL